MYKIFSRSDIPNGYYVYAYIRTRDSANGKAGTPYYIGKGKDVRAIDKHSIPIPKDPSKIIVIADGLTELWSFLLERFLIKMHGRIDNKTGILHNRTDGGEGASGRIYIPTVEAIEKMRKSKTGKPLSRESIIKREETRRRNSNHLQTPESIAKMVESKKDNIGWTNGIENKRCKQCPGDGWYLGYTPSSEERVKRSVAHVGKPHKQRLFECQHCGKQTTKTNLIRWHKNCANRLLTIEKV